MKKKMSKFTNTLILEDAFSALKKIETESVELAITSPPYWNLVDYGFEGQIGDSNYEEYINNLLKVWKEIYRILTPNGKLCVNTPIVPISKESYSNQHTRHLKNINNDIEQSILKSTKFLRLSLYIWKKQTTTKMFGSYPFPPNIYEDNTIEFINVFVKDGKPKVLPKIIKEASRLTQKVWLELTKQIWPIYPEDVKRAGNHPVPFPLELPARLIAMYTFKELPEKNFLGDTVLDMFVGSGTTCVAATLLGRNYIGIDLGKKYIDFAKKRIKKYEPMRGKVKIEDLITFTVNSWFKQQEKPVEGTRKLIF